MGIVDLGKQYSNNVRIINVLTGENENTIRKYCISKSPLHFPTPQALASISAGLAHAAEMGTRMPWLPSLPIAKASATTGKFCPHCGKEL